MIQAIWQGHARPLDSTYASASWAYEPDVPKFPYDPAAAAQLLDQAGWTLNPATGIREKDGQPLKLRLFYAPPGSKTREQTATIAQQMLKHSGIDTDIIPEDFSAWQDRLNQTHDFDLTIGGWAQALEPHALANLWVTGGGQNFTGFTNPDVDRLLDQAVRVFAENDRKPYYSQVQKIIAEEQPYVFLWEIETLKAINNRIVLPYAPGESRLGPNIDVWRWYSRTGQ
jgi:peptide/nickel transport system substrate-binding protein